jgi:hypothetical protein
MPATISLPARALWHSRDRPQLGAARLSVNLSEERGAAASPKVSMQTGRRCFRAAGPYFPDFASKRAVHGGEFPLGDFLHAALETNFGWVTFCMTALKLNFRWAAFCMTALKANFGWATFCKIAQR